MTTADVSRFARPIARHYSGARLQQGRALTDSDFNEEVDADREDRRRAAVQVVGGRGSPDQGFLPDIKPGAEIPPQLVRFGSLFQQFALNYNIQPGVMYAGGLRFELEEPEPILFQRDFLQMGPLQAPRAAFGVHNELAIFRGWEQPVSAIEDGELLETAMGGPDSTVRIRRMRRVEVTTVQSDECEAAFDELLEFLTFGDIATWDEETGELKSNARLRMRFLRHPSAEDCQNCTPMLSSRYLGHENHAIRLMLTSSTEYVWGYDNAAHLYRVKVFFEGAGRARVQMLTPPKDAFQAPGEHTVVEFLPWGALLENGKPPTGKVPSEQVKNEKVASPIGFFGEVTAGYDPNSGELEVTLDPRVEGRVGVIAGKDAAFLKNKAKLKKKKGVPILVDTIAVRWDEDHPDAGQLNPQEDGTGVHVAYVYMRVWHKKRPEDPLFIPSSSTRPLGGTGLVPELLHQGKPGDYWTISVRPNARDEIVPSELLRQEGAPPHGPREFVMPLYLIQWTSQVGLVNRVTKLLDCRPRFRALTDSACCTVIVSEGPEGQTNSIQRAVDLLPPEGGKVCVRPGTYQGQIVISGKRSVVIEGCGMQSLIESDGVTEGGALVDIIGPSGAAANVSLVGLGIHSQGQIGVRFSGEGLTMRDCTLHTEPVGGTQTQPAISIERGSEVRIRRNRVTMDGTESPHAAVYVETTFDLGGADIEDNEIETLRNVGVNEVHAWGGLHLASGAKRVRVRRNHIVGGNGHGITLGSVVFIATDGDVRLRQGAGFTQMTTGTSPSVTGKIESFDEDQGGGVMKTFYADPARGDGNEAVVMNDVVIVDNEIEQTNTSGIGSLAMIVENSDAIFFDQPPYVRGALFRHENLAIEGNRIHDCVQVFLEEGPGYHAPGAIALSHAENLDIRGNEIRGNGVPQGAAGILLGAGRSLRIESNRLLGNGPTSAENADALNAGIFVGPIAIFDVQENDTVRTIVTAAFPRQVFIRRNTIDAPLSPAVVVIASGAVAADNNSIGVRNGAEGVAIVNLGIPWEAIEPEDVDVLFDEPAATFDYLEEAAMVTVPQGDGGATLFGRNQVSCTSDAGPDNDPRVVVLALDHLSFSDNQIAAQMETAEALAVTQMIAATMAVSQNRFSEGMFDSSFSFLSVGLLMSVVTRNTSTHCYGALANDPSPQFAIDEQNLVLLPPNGGCEPPSFDSEDIDISSIFDIFF